MGGRGRSYALRRTPPATKLVASVSRPPSDLAESELLADVLEVRFGARRASNVQLNNPLRCPLNIASHVPNAASWASRVQFRSDVLTLRGQVLMRADLGR